MPHVGCSGVAGPLPYRRMSWLRRLLGGSSDHEVKPQRLDYLSEALTLERQGDYDAALTSYKLALRDQPNDHRVLQNMAIAYSKTGRHEEAVRCYRQALDQLRAGGDVSDPDSRRTLLDDRDLSDGNPAFDAGL